MSQAVIVNKIKQTQQDELKELVEEMRRCAVCKKNKPHLYICEHDGCDQGNRLLCRRCGVFTHDEDYDHQFHTNKSYIKEALLQMALSTQNDVDIKKHVQEIHYMVKSMEEEKTSGERTLFHSLTTYGVNAIDTFEKVGVWVKNDKYFAKQMAVMCNALRNGEIKQFGTTMKTVLFDVGDRSLELSTKCREGAVIAGAVLFGLEAAWHTYRLIKGDLSLKNYGKKILSSASMATGAMVGNIGGTAVGAAIGTIIFPFIGSAAGGVIGGLLGSIFVGAKAKQAVEEISWFNDKNEQKLRHDLIKEALVAFGFTWKDIKNDNVFTAEKIAKKYRTRAKEAHPDRGGSEEAFIKLNIQLSILLAMLEQDDNIKEETSKKIEAITLQ